MSLRIRLVLALATAAGVAFPQASSRTGEIEQARQAKASELKPEELSKTEQRLNYVKDHKILERLTAGVAGFRVLFGGLVSGSGFALGPEYLKRTLAGGNLTLRAAARSSFQGYQLYEAQALLPRLAGGRLSLDLQANHRNYPGINYYGPGPDSRKTGRSNFRLEDTACDVRAALAPAPRWRLGATGGYLQVNVGPGTDRRFVSSERIYGPQAAAGIDRQSDFLRGGVFTVYDWRDNPGGPRRGGSYSAEYTYYGDRRLELHTFRKLDLELQQYFPFFNERRVIALRARSTLTYSNPGQRVPFYLQPVAGGSETLRGFRPFRFYDDNLVVFNGEYRWETFSGLDMALFADAGKVFPRRGQLNFKDLEGSAGFGFRFNVRNSVFLRIDVGFSHEGYQLWLKFNNVF